MIMKLVAALCAILVCGALAECVRAQTYTPGELRATKVVADAQDRADAIRRRLDAPTLTPVPTRTPTETPTPTATSTPTAQPIATTTSVPSATGTPIVVAVQATARATPATAPPKRDPMTIVGIVIMFGILIGAGVAVFLYSKRRAQYG